MKTQSVVFLRKLLTVKQTDKCQVLRNWPPWQRYCSTDLASLIVGYRTVDTMCVIEEQDSSKADEQSADTSELSSSTSSTVRVWLQCCVILTSWL